MNNMPEELISNILHAGSEENARKAIDIYTAQIEEAVLEKINNTDFFRWSEKTRDLIKKEIFSTFFIEQKMKEFDDKFREYISAGITYAEIQEAYKPLDFEDEVKWIQNFIKQALKEQAEQACDEILKRAEDTTDYKEKSGLLSASDIVSKYKEINLKN